MSKKMLHEIIAVEGDLTAAAAHLIDEAKGTFAKRTEHFNGHTRSVLMFDAERESENTTDHRAVVTTVDDKLEYTWKGIVGAINVTATKENTNSSMLARADVIVEGVIVLKDLPATALLGLERRLTALREMYKVIPTLDPTYTWVVDENQTLGMFRTNHPTEQLKTEKTLEHKVLYDATKEHPAQIESYSRDKPVGKITHDRLSGMVSVATKAKWLTRIAQLQVAVKEARQRANKAEVKPLVIGRDIQGFIHA